MSLATIQKKAFDPSHKDIVCTSHKGWYINVTSYPTHNSVRYETSIWLSTDEDSDAAVAVDNAISYTIGEVKEFIKETINELDIKPKEVIAIAQKHDLGQATIEEIIKLK